MVCNFDKSSRSLVSWISVIPFATLLSNSGDPGARNGSRLRGVTSDLSLRGCFVRTTSHLEVRARVRLTLAKKKQKVEILAAIRKGCADWNGPES